jgi:hypothetical protein
MDDIAEMQAPDKEGLEENLGLCAVGHAARGFRVIRLAAGSKIAIDSGWPEKATTDREEVQKLWWDPVMGAHLPYNVGVATGQGLVVIDVDVKGSVNGHAALSVLELMHGDLPETYTVETPSGGCHYYFATPEPIGCPKPRPGIDIKGERGYVVAAGSVTPVGRYRCVSDLPIADLPGGWTEWLFEPSAARTHAALGGASLPLSYLDPEAVAESAIHYLEGAEPAVEGDGGDNWTFSVAAQCRNLGVATPEAVCELMLDHWNDRCSPPWQLEDLLVKCRNAFAYSQQGTGAKSAEAEFEPVEVVDRRTVSDDLVPGILSLEDMDAVPPREWLLGDKAMRGYVTMVVSPGGGAKTTFLVTTALAGASGQQLLHDSPHHPMRVWYYNLEDDLQEMRRRFRAAIEYHGLPREVLGRIRVNSGRDRGLKILRADGDQIVVLPDKAKLIAALRREGIELLIIDPFIYAHSLPEKSNEAMGEALRQFNQIAHASGAAIVLVHHTRKGAEAGDADSVRGGSAQVGGARKVLTLATMDEREAKRLGVPEDKRRFLIRVDSAKSNMSPPAHDAEWLQLVSVNLDNATEEYPKGDNVQTVRRWTPPDPMRGVTAERIEACLAAIEAGLPDGARYTRHARSADRHVVPLIADTLGTSTGAAEELLRRWLKERAIEEREYRTPQRKLAKGLFRVEGAA